MAEVKSVLGDLEKGAAEPPVPPAPLDSVAADTSPDAACGVAPPPDAPRPAPDPAVLAEHYARQAAATGPLHRLAALLVMLLLIIDAPFARLSPTTKGVIGCIAIPTFVVALATWFGRPYLR